MHYLTGRLATLAANIPWTFPSSCTLNKASHAPAWEYKVNDGMRQTETRDPHGTAGPFGYNTGNTVNCSMYWGHPPKKFRNPV